MATTRSVELWLTAEDEAKLAGDHGPGVAMAMRLVVALARVSQATQLIDIESAHIDGCLYHGQAGLDFIEKLVSLGAKVTVPTTLNVSSLDLLHPGLVRLDPAESAAARRLMDAYVAIGARATWTCAPYQLAGRPEAGTDIAWAESNAIVFANFRTRGAHSTVRRLRGRVRRRHRAGAVCRFARGGEQDPDARAGLFDHPRPRARQRRGVGRTRLCRGPRGR